MISGRTRYLIHTVVGCLAYPTIVVVLVKSIYEALVSGVTTGKRFVCNADADAVCYTSSLLVLAVFVVFFRLARLRRGATFFLDGESLM
jgi:hypothetical protein